MRGENLNIDGLIVLDWVILIAKRFTAFVMRPWGTKFINS